jgi:hypothetical protein
MFAILERGETCELDIVGHRCNRVFDELGWGMPSHANCQDTLAESIREYGLTPDDVHDSFNLWMATDIDPDGRRRFRWNPAVKGDRIDLLAMFDVLAAQVICGCGDIVGINNFGFEPVTVEIYEASPATTELADRAEGRWGRLAGQDKSSDMPVLTDRELRRDPGYVPSFRPAPKVVDGIEVELGPEEREMVAGLRETGLYGATDGEVLRAAFMRWCNLTFTRVRRPKIEFSA